MAMNQRIDKRLEHYHTIIPLVERGALMRLDTFPFIVAYGILIAIDLNAIKLSSIEGIQKWCHILLFPLVLFSHFFLFLATHWSVSLDARVGYKRGSTETSKKMDEWTHCLVKPPLNSGAQMNGRTEIVPISYHDFHVEGKSGRVASINYEETRFRACLYDGIGQDVEMDSIWMPSETRSATKLDSPATVEKSKVKTLFHRLHYPNDMSLSFYTKRWIGHNSKSLELAKQVYSNNSIRINLPPFVDLLKQQLVAPFFLFQLLCVLLWCLDEYWYYAIFTLFTLILFECSVAYTRLKDLQRLRDTLRMPFGVWVYRSQWELVSSEELVVGDIVSLSSSSTSQHVDHEGGTHVPADLLLIKGGAVVNEATLTGESVPQMKSSINDVASTLIVSNGEKDPCLDMEDGNYKSAILFGGTVLVNHSNADSTDYNMNNAGSSIPASPDGGCIAFVLRTGFDTQQGSLLRTMIHTSTKQAQSNTANSWDTFIFILILLSCAMISSVYVLFHGWNDPTRNRFKLVLHVIIIITSVVPPELPMELSLAVTSSISDLVHRCSVYCTEPFRIPLAGMVNTCCFDKTGTLTSDEMILRGVRLPKLVNGALQISPDLTLPVTDGDDEELNLGIPKDSLRVLVGCHSLTTAINPKMNSTRNSDNLVGDPLEKAVFDSCGWNLLPNNIVAPPQSLLRNFEINILQVLHRFAFTSKLKRMTVIAKDLNDKDVWALSKGAPETLKDFMDQSSVPENYDSVSRFHMSKGQRVLALAYKKLKDGDNKIWKQKGRSEIERNLTFAGLIVLDCPLKPDTRKVIKELRHSDHSTVMITGDAVLTSAEVAKQCGIISTKGNGEIYELRNISETEGENKLAFVPIHTPEMTVVDSEKCIAYSDANLAVVKDLLKSGNIRAICVSGDTLDTIAMIAVRKNLKDSSVSHLDPKTVLLHPDSQRVLQKLVPFISVFARHAPRQKEAVIAAMNGAGRITLMCGDGTNDVGALKMAHCGISIVSVPDLEAKQRTALEGLHKLQEGESKSTKKKKSKSRKTTTWEEHAKALMEAEEELNHVGLGDASVASPFTSRVTSIKCTTDVLQRGRCTLVTMNQIYKILGVNCLVNALVLSTLHLAGVKQGDTQLTAVGIVVAGLFFFVTKGQPLNKLSRHRPPSSVLSKQVLLSIALQFFIHCTCIMAITVLSKLYLDSFDPSLVPDGAFNPNTLNSATFIMTVLCTVNTFVVNYRGRPYMEDLRENKMMVRALQMSYAILFCCALEMFPPLNDLLQLAPLPANSNVISMHCSIGEHDIYGMSLQILPETIGFKLTLCLFMIIDSLCSYLGEKSLIRFFEPNVLK